MSATSPSRPVGRDVEHPHGDEAHTSITRLRRDGHGQVVALGDRRQGLVERLVLEDSRHQGLPEHLATIIDHVEGRPRRRAAKLGVTISIVFPLTMYVCPLEHRRQELMDGETADMGGADARRRRECYSTPRL